MNEDLDAHYILENSVNASETRTWNDRKGFLPIGNSTNPFNGYLDGNGFEILELEVNRSEEDFIGLVSISSHETRIIDLTLSEVKIVGNNYTGGLIGSGNGNILNCSVIGEVNGGLNAGGFFGTFNGMAEGCYSAVNVQGHYNIGGAVGYQQWGLLRNSSSHGSVHAKSGVGGLVGQSDGRIEKCYATGDVFAEGTVGGLIGFTGNYGAIVKNCYATGNVIGSNGTAAGLIGYIERGQISNSYSIGKVSAKNYAGGLIGSHRPGLSSLVYSYWDKETSGRNTSDLGYGMVTDNMMKEKNFVSWDFENIWNIVEDRSYPFLRTCDYDGKCEIVSCMDNTSAFEDHAYNLVLDANTSLPGGKGAFWNITTDAGSWLTVTGSGILSGTPTNDDVGQYRVNTSATINHIDFDYLNFTLEVVNTNDPPSIDTTNMPHAMEDEFYSHDFEGSDIDPVNDKLTWSMETDGEFLHIDPDTGKIWGLPLNKDTGSCSIKIILDDGNGGSDEKEFRINVFNINDDPVILPFEVPEVFEDEEFIIDMDAFDEDPTQDNMLWTMDTNTGFLEIGKRSGIITGLPGNEDVGTWWVLVNLTDEKGGYDNKNFTIEVIDVNDPPAILPFNDSFTIEDEPFILDIDAIDIDTVGGLLWEMATNASFLTIDGATGIISGTPSNNDVGLWKLNVSLKDGEGGFDFIVFYLQVLNTNDAPITRMDDRLIEMYEDSLGIELDLNSLFIDVDGDDLSFDLSSVENLIISVHDGILNVSPERNWSGEEDMEISATDGIETEYLEITIRVLPVNDAPFDINIIATSKYQEGQAQIVNSSAEDVDIPYGDVLTFTWSSNITGMIGKGNRLNLSLPEGHHLITLNVTDSEGRFISRSFELEVLGIDEPVEIEDQDDDGIPIGVIVILTLTIMLLLSGLSILFVVWKGKEKNPVEEEDPPIGFKKGPPPSGYHRSEGDALNSKQDEVYLLKP